MGDVFIFHLHGTFTPWGQESTLHTTGAPLSDVIIGNISEM